MANYEEYLASKEFSDVTNINPVSAGFLGILSLLIFRVSHSYLFVPLCIGIVLVPISQRIGIAGVNLFSLRIILLICLVRLFFRSEFKLVKFNKIDKTICLWMAAMLIVYVLRVQTFGAVINRLGYSLNILGSYFIFRAIIRSFDDIDRIIKFFVFLSAILAAAMFIEYTIGINLFYILGANRFASIDSDGGIQCLGTFGHPISAGIFGAVMLPVFSYLLCQGKSSSKKTAVIGIISATVITYTSSSSTTYLAYIVAVIVTLFMWPWRKYARVFAWTGVFAVIGLHIVMKAPVWALIDRAAVFGSSSAYHRFVIVDGFINNFHEWWLLGTDSTAHWHLLQVQAWDLSNLFVRIGVDGGLISLILFIFLMMKCFQTLWHSMKLNENNIQKEKLFWAMGASLFTNIVAFFGFSYWDQLSSILFMLVAMISVVGEIEAPISN